MVENINVTVLNTTKTYESGVTYEKIAKDFQDRYDAQIVLAEVNGKLCELHKMPGRDCSINFVTVADKAGFNTYRRSCTFLLMKAFTDVVGRDKLNRLKAEFTVSKGLYCTASGDFTLDERLLRSVKAKMDDLVSQNIPIWKSSYSIDEAIETFKKSGMTDKVKLFKYRRASKVNVYSLGDYKDYYYGYMVASTGYLTCYDLELFDEGFVLRLPTRKEFGELPDFKPDIKLFNTMKDTNDWGRNIGVETVGALNDRICEGGFTDLMMVQEARIEGNISDIAGQIAKRESVKFVMIAGPSSSGKTTFSHRLSVQLRAHGLRPHPIGLDNYYKDRSECPKDENGQYDFECLEALDVEGFNRDMKALLDGETVELPVFNFKTGKREYKGDFLTLKDGDILVIEGIHGLNEKMSYVLPKESKFKVYISALTSMNVDEHNRIPTTDIRLIRRMVRDYRTRGTSAKGTLAMWDSVRRGEEKYIFPFQESADAMFNSAHVYELCVLKQFAEPLLFGIIQEEPEYQEAKRLLKFLDYFLGVTSEQLPNNSIIREFVGGSLFNV